MRRNHVFFPFNTLLEMLRPAAVRRRPYAAGHSFQYSIRDAVDHGDTTLLPTGLVFQYSIRDAAQSQPAALAASKSDLSILY